MADFDVAVLGGGPAGSTVARSLALRGHRVCLLHRCPQAELSRARWEALSPGALELIRLHYPDVWPSIAHALVPCRTKAIWTRRDEKSEQRAVNPGTLVDRHLLDRMLLTSAVAAGAIPYVVGRGLRKPSRICNSSVWVLSRDYLGTPGIRSRFLVDAAGRSSAFQGTRFALGPRTLALTAQVTAMCLRPRSTCVEALADSWLWAARGDEATTNVILFISPRTVRNWSPRERSILFLKTIGKSSLAEAGGPPRIMSNLIVRDATALKHTPLTDDGLLRAGDAALAFDPLSGQGVQHALASAAQVAIVLHTMLLREESSALAREFYSTRHAEAAHEHVSACRIFYQRQDRFDGEFWRERKGGSTLPFRSERRSVSLHTRMHETLILSPEVYWKEIPVIARGFIEKKQALFHPSLTRPVAYLEGQAAFHMLVDLAGEVTGFALLQRWADRAGLTKEAGLRALCFLLRHNILVRVGAQGRCKLVIRLPASHTERR